MRIEISNRRGQRTTLDVPNNITVEELDDRYARIIGVGGHRFQYRFLDEVLKYDRNLSYYGIEHDDIIVANEYSRGGGGEHTCPYGCGRNIPDNYKGCTELLKDFPNYFDNK